jgi:hypothetical protein
LDTSSAASWPLAPPRLSTMICWPSVSAKFLRDDAADDVGAAARREPTSMRMGLAG